MPETGRLLSLAALTVLELPPTQAITVASACGYDAIGLRPLAATPHEAQYDMLHDAVLQRQLRDTLRGCGLGVLDLEIVRLTPHMDWPLLHRLADFAGELGAKRLLVADNDPDPARAHDHLAALAQLGQAVGLTPHLEFMPWTHAPNLAAAKARITGIANCQLLIDAFHLARSGGTPADIPPGDADIGYIQLCDIAGPIPPMDEILREARSDRLMPGMGEIDLPALLARLPGLPISLEIPADRLRDTGHNAAARARMAIDHARAVLRQTEAQGGV